MPPSKSKSELRKQLRTLRSEQVAKRAASQIICQRLAELPAYRSARVVMHYVDVRSELQLRAVIQREGGGAKRVVVPYCDGDDLAPWELKDWNELTSGAFGILEPRDDLRLAADRFVTPECIDLICVPGVGFDRQGNRLGSGRGYYDRLLPKLRPDAIKIGLAYECQVVREIPVESHDVPMDFILTEASVYDVRQPV